jgi:hypothetical protein
VAAPLTVWFWRSGPGGGLAAMSEDFGRIVDQMESEVDLEERVADLRRAHARKRDIGLSLLAGRLTLRQAAAGFADASVKSPTLEAVWRKLHPGETNDERYCREVLTWVRVELHDRPEEEKKALARLQAQLPTSSAPAPERDKAPES